MHSKFLVSDLEKALETTVTPPPFTLQAELLAQGREGLGRSWEKLSALVGGQAGRVHGKRKKARSMGSVG